MICLIEQLNKFIKKQESNQNKLMLLNCMIASLLMNLLPMKHWDSVLLEKRVNLSIKHKIPMEVK